MASQQLIIIIIISVTLNQKKIKKGNQKNGKIRKIIIPRKD